MTHVALIEIKLTCVDFRLRAFHGPESGRGPRHRERKHFPSRECALDNEKMQIRSLSPTQRCDCVDDTALRKPSRTYRVAGIVRGRRSIVSRVWRAIIASSSVGIIRTETRLSGALMIAAFRPFATASRSTPSQPRRAQTISRIAGACSPMPAVKTRPSSPPNELVRAPISRAIRYTKSSIASLARGRRADQKGPHIAGDPVGDAEQSRTLIKQVFDLLRGQPSLLLQIEDHSRIEISATRPHDQAVQRREPHRGVDAAAVQHGAKAGAIAEMSCDYASLGQFGRDLGQLSGDVFIGKTVEAVAPHASPLILARQRKTGRDGGHRMMKGCVEAHDLWEIQVVSRRSPLSARCCGVRAKARAASVRRAR